MAKLAILLGCIAVLFGVFLCFDSFTNSGLMWNFFTALGIGLVPFGAYIAIVNYRIMREDNN
ncbi:TPA: hypothetical protein ACX6NR_002870 [Photobacterium damselae]|uniref:hypothetical protein n=1 Tax=Photobacterium damselae TaxID=38293 RepID=UPI002542B44D